jgi:hypothetical protein
VPFKATMKKYELLLKNEKLRTYNLIGWLLFSLQIVALLALAFIFENKNVRGPARSGLILIALVATILYLLRNTRYSSSLPVLLFACLIIWLSTRIYPATGISGFIFLLHNLATTKKIVRVNEDQISYPGFLPNFIPWKNISSCLIKDDLLTIDLKNNKLFQHLIEEKTEIDEKEFNEFCSERINRSN